MNARPSVVVILFRYFVTVFVILFVISVFWNTLSGTNMFPIKAVIGSSLVLTVLFNIIGWVINTVAGELLFGRNVEYQKWKKLGGRPYWDSLGRPINPASQVERQTGLAEPEYTDFVPPADWCYQCPACGARVEKQIDVCWNCNYGADGDSTAYHERWGDG